MPLLPRTSYRLAQILAFLCNPATHAAKPLGIPGQFFHCLHLPILDKMAQMMFMAFLVMVHQFFSHGCSSHSVPYLHSIIPDE
jgi:hypothetical protein